MSTLITLIAHLHQLAGSMYPLVFPEFSFWSFPFQSIHWASSTMNVLTGPKSMAPVPHIQLPGG